MSSLVKNIITLSTLLILAVLGYYLFVIERDSTLNTGTSLVSSGDRDAQDFIRRLEDLQQIQLSTEIFSDKRFRQLKDFSTVIERVPSGRSTPFEEPTDLGSF